MARNKKYWQDRFGNVEHGAYHSDFDLRRIEDLDDNGLAILLTNVRGIDSLNLSETEISNDAIRLLTELEYIKKLSLQGCENIDEGCIATLNKLTSLTMLYVRNTGISINGLLQLDKLVNLKRLLFSASNEDSLQEKMLLMKERFPNCTFVIDSVPYRFEEE